MLIGISNNSNIIKDNIVISDVPNNDNIDDMHIKIILFKLTNAFHNSSSIIQILILILINISLFLIGTFLNLITKFVDGFFLKRKWFQIFLKLKSLKPSSLSIIFFNSIFVFLCIICDIKKSIIIYHFYILIIMTIIYSISHYILIPILYLIDYIKYKADQDFLKESKTKKAPFAFIKKKNQNKIFKIFSSMNYLVKKFDFLSSIIIFGKLFFLAFVFMGINQIMYLYLFYFMLKLIKSFFKTSNNISNLLFWIFHIGGPFIILIKILLLVFSYEGVYKEIEKQKRK